MFKNKAESGMNNICGDKIKALRKANKLSQRALADELQLIGLDVGKNSIQQIESGERFVTDIELKFFSEYFKTPVDVLLGTEFKDDYINKLENVAETYGKMDDD